MVSLQTRGLGLACNSSIRKLVVLFENSASSETLSFELLTAVPQVGHDSAQLRLRRLTATHLTRVRDLCPFTTRRGSSATRGILFTVQKLADRSIIDPSVPFCAHAKLHTHVRTRAAHTSVAHTHYSWTPNC
jgi:hypothetical protein